MNTLSSSKQVVEILQNDGITVKERIIRFFEQKTSREYAEMFYNEAYKAGLVGGTSVFVQAIQIICDELELSATELSNQIKDHSNQN